MEIKCKYITDCQSTRTEKCKRCKNNIMRNFVQDYFEEAKDKPIPKNNPRLSFNGPAEQTAGYQCPVCGGFTNPYQVYNKLCSHCGFKLNI